MHFRKKNMNYVLLFQISLSIRSTQAVLLLWTCFLLFSWILSGRMAIQIASIKEFLCYGLCKIISHASGFATFPMRLPMIRGILSILFIMLKPINPWFYPGQISSRRVTFHGKDRSMIYLKPDLILYVESCGSHTLLHTSTQTFECVERLSALCKRCEPELIRCHESYLVNLTYVASIQRFSFTLTNGISIPIPEKRYTHIKKLLANFSSSPEVKE